MSFAFLNSFFILFVLFIVVAFILFIHYAIQRKIVHVPLCKTVLFAMTGTRYCEHIRDDFQNFKLVNWILLPNAMQLLSSSTLSHSKTNIWILLLFLPPFPLAPMRPNPIRSKILAGMWPLFCPCGFDPLRTACPIPQSHFFGSCGSDCQRAHTCGFVICCCPFN